MTKLKQRRQALKQIFAASAAAICLIGTGAAHAATCNACNGNGKCRQCGGGGKDAQGRRCSSCSGSGTCGSCNGTGKTG